jgi:FkbM family methyltransferase
MSNYVSQYFRDVSKLLNAKNKKNKIRLYLIYNKFCIKNIFMTKIFRIKTKKARALGYTFYYDNFNSFFAMFSEIFLHDIYGELQLQSKTPIIADCGANIGIATIYFKYKYPKAKVYCFEPDPGTFEILKKNCEENKFSDIILHNKALSDTDGKIKFYSYGNFEGSPGNTINKKWVNFKNVKEHSIDCMTLSSLNLRKIDLLKIDVEGAEGKIIKDLKHHDALKTIEKFSLEYHYGTESKENELSEILSALEQNNFDFVINPDSLIQDRIQIDEFIEHRKYVLIINCVKKKKFLVEN